MMVHVRHDGASHGLELAVSVNDTDGAIKMAVARRLDMAPELLDRYAVDRNSDSMVVRPEAVYG